MNVDLRAGTSIMCSTGGTTTLGVAPYTTDGDVVLDPTRLQEEPELEVVMKSAGFDLDRKDDGSQEPGIWIEY